MPRERVRAVQSDFRGGLNTSYSDDILDPTEYRGGQNLRSLLGELEKRAGSKRLHGTAIGAGASVKGVFQWDAPLGSQLIAVCGSDFYHKLLAAANYTEVAASLSITDRVTFAPYRIGGNVKVLIADGSGIFTWDGTTLASVAGAPTADRALIYKLRAFAFDGSKTLYYSKTGDPTKWAVADGGGFVDIETYNDAQIMAGIVVGSSLLIFKEDNTARFTGVDTSNIRVDVETEGISAEVGCIAPNTVCRFDEAAFFLSDRGPYIATEAGVKEIGLKVARSFDFGNRLLWLSAQAAHNRRRKEVWLSLGAPSDSDDNTRHTWIWNYQTGSWSGPFIFSFDVSVIGRYERADGTESVMIGGFDGFVRDADVEEIGSIDDVLSTGTGGSAVEMDLQLADVTADVPDTLKNMRQVNEIVADLGAVVSGEDSALTAYWESELGSGEVDIPTKGVGLFTYRYKLATAKGARLILGFRSTSQRMVKILGVFPRLTLSRKAR